MAYCAQPRHEADAPNNTIVWKTITPGSAGLTGSAVPGLTYVTPVGMGVTGSIYFAYGHADGVTMLIESGGYAKTDIFNAAFSKLSAR